MSASGTDGPKSPALKTAFVYLCVSLLVAFFGAVYELFSHEVYSFYMIYAFAFPLVGGVLPYLVIGLYGKRKSQKSALGVLYHCGVATLTVGSILQGVLEIYGTTSSLLRVYWIVGPALTVIGAAACLIQTGAASDP